MSDVPYTCPLIDSVIEVVKDLENIPGLGDGDDFEDLTIAEIRDTVGEVQGFDADDIRDALDKLETIRGHNETLREESEGFESDKDDLQSRVDDLESELEDAKSELEDARSELRAMERQIEELENE